MDDYMICCGTCLFACAWSTREALIQCRLIVAFLGDQVTVQLSVMPEHVAGTVRAQETLRLDASECPDLLKVECAGLRVGIVEEIESLQPCCDSIGNRISDVGVFEIVEIRRICKVAGHDMNLRSAQSLQR